MRGVYIIYTSFPGGVADDGNAAIKARAKYASIFCRAEAVKSHPCGGLIYLCYCIKKLKFLSSTFCRRKGGANRRCGARAEGACTLCRAARRKRRECGLKPRGDKFSGSQLAVGKMVAFALLRVKRSPFLNPPSALRPLSENSSAAFLLSPTEYTL